MPEYDYCTCGFVFIPESEGVGKCFGCLHEELEDMDDGLDVFFECDDFAYPPSYQSYNEAVKERNKLAEELGKELRPEIDPNEGY